MIEALPPASWETTLRGRFAPCAGGRRLPLRALDAGAFEDVADEQDFLPAPLGRGWDGRFYWWYQGAVVRAYAELDPEVVAAKLHGLERDRRTRSTAVRTLLSLARAERRDLGACAECGSGEGVRFELIDERVPAGASDPANLRLLCERCSVSVAVQRRAG